MRRASIVLVGLSLVALGCGKDSSPAQPQASGTAASSPPTGSPSESPSETPSPTESAAPGVTVGAVFYSDDFKTTAKNWTTKATENAEYTYHTDYATPLYTVKAKKGGFHLFPHPEFRGVTREQLADYEVTALIQTTLNLGREDWFGVTCRDLNNQRYSFRMAYPTSGDKIAPWNITKHDEGKTTVLAEGEHEVGGSAFEISGACVGGTGTPATLVMKINDKVVGTATDDTPYTAGYGGVYLLSKEGTATINVLSFAARTATLAS